jgi:Flp pilus assembly protein CpaB
MTTATVTAPRRRSARLPRVDTRLVVGLLLVALSIIGGLRLAATGEASVVVYTAARDLPAGHRLERGDLATTHLRAPARVLDRLVRGVAPVDRVLRVPLAEGDLVPGTALGTGARREREITVPIAAEHALGGALRPGDRVDVLASFDKGTEAARTLTVAARAQVVDVVRSDGLFGQREGELSAITLGVQPDDAVLVAFAVRNGEIDVVRAHGPGHRVRTRFDADELP